MTYISENQVRGFANTALGKSYKSFEESRIERAQASIFLSHSHKDRDWIEDIIVYIAYNTGVHIYVDWQDRTMPAVTNRATAERIKKKIGELDVFVVLATPNAMASRWVPWELGIADTLKGSAKIGILPAIDREGNYPGNEYLQLYRRIEISTQNRLAILTS